MPHASAPPTRNPEGGAAVRARPRLRLVEGEPGRPGLLQGDESRLVHQAPLPYLLKSLLSLLLIGWHIVRGFPVISSGVRAANPDGSSSLFAANPVISSPFRARCGTAWWRARAPGRASCAATASRGTACRSSPSPSCRAIAAAGWGPLCSPPSSSGTRSSATPRCRSRSSAPTPPRVSTSDFAFKRSLATTVRP